MTQNRGERRARTRKVVKKRLTVASRALIFGLDQRKKEEPMRMSSHKPKYTQDRSSMKEEKRLANRAARRKAREAARRAEEPIPEPKKSVRWNYW